MRQDPLTVFISSHAPQLLWLWCTLPYAYNDGRVFHTEADPFEKKAFSADSAPATAKVDLGVLADAMAILKRQASR